MSATSAAEQIYGFLKREAARALQEIDPTKPYGTALFGAIARVSVTVCIEAVCLWQMEGRMEVLLTKRDVNDPAYPNMWHCPGTTMRPGESI